MFPKPEFYGSATVGERGQIVLPASARKRLGLAKGDKMLVVGGPGPLMGVMLVKVDVLDDMLQMLTTEMANCSSWLDTCMAPLHLSPDSV